MSMFSTELVPLRNSLCLGELAKEYEKKQQTVEEKKCHYNPFEVQLFQSYNPLYRLFQHTNTTVDLAQVGLNQEKQFYSLDSLWNVDLRVIESRIPIHIKYAPLLDPVHYLIGKYSNWKEAILPQPDVISPIPKIDDVHNVSYVDSFYNFLSSRLLQTHGFVHGLEFYGSFLAIQDKFKFDISDDYEYLSKSKIFRTQYKKWYEYEDPVQIETLKRFYMDNGDTQENRKPLRISSLEKAEDIAIEIDGDIEDCGVDGTTTTSSDTTDSMEVMYNTLDSTKPIDEDDSDSGSSDGDDNSMISDSTVNDDEMDKDDEIGSDASDGSDGSNSSNESNSSDESDESDDDDIHANAYIYNFPVQMICLEKCDGTLDNLLESECLSTKEQSSALAQVIFTLLLYQNTFQFTHNDLHTNNIMYKSTNVSHIEYVYKNKHYLVPTFGKIYKIIDFGRSIYTYKNKVYCSDSFAKGGDAHSQYNCEPFYNKDKPRIEPNPSFDLCRLGCSLYDFMFDVDDESYRSMVEGELNPIQSAVLRWCTDNRGKNILYKASSGDERYPNFKLYKMIARHVHNITPEEELSHSLIQQYEWDVKKQKKKKVKCTNKMVLKLDEIPNYAKSL